MTPEIPSSDDVMVSLRDFQRSTANYAFERLYGSAQPSIRFLVADEVGLGKTLVARGVIAKVMEHLRSIGDKRIDIVYICSNGAIARQNLRKLNVAGDEVITEADRFTLLVNEVGKLEKRPMNLIAVTPGTSFDFGHSQGRFEERALLYALLKRVWGPDRMKGKGAERFFYLGISDNEAASRRLKATADKATLARSVVRAFGDQIKRINQARKSRGDSTLWIDFRYLKEQFRRKGGWTKADRRARNDMLVELRRALTTVGIEALQPDLVILDEFQRFRRLLDHEDDSWASRLAHELFDFEDPISSRPTRTLLLSATPYRPFTTSDDTDDDHYEDLIHTARFLLESDAKAELLRSDLRDLRRALLIVDRDGGESAERACRRVGERLRPVMARTERLAATPDRSGMLHSQDISCSLERTDVEGYLAAATAADLLGHRDVVEYWKSAPYLLNFMEGYALKKAFDEHAEEGTLPAGLKTLIDEGSGLLAWDDVERYEQVDPGNGRLRALTEDVLDRGMWRCLWLPPSLPYYEAEGSGSDSAGRAFSKRLVFSAWHVVPKVISAMLSYEAERRVFESASESRANAYTDFKNRSDRLLEFRVERARTESMAHLLLVAPLVSLARCTDPLELRASIEAEGVVPSVATVRLAAAERVAAMCAELSQGAPATGPVDQRWYWAAPLLADIGESPDECLSWWRTARAKLWTAEPNEEESRFADHLRRLRHFGEELEEEPLGRPPDDLTEVLADVGLGSPAAVAYRSFTRLVGPDDAWGSEVLAGACRVAWGFRSLFSGPEATSIVRAATGNPEPYWQGVLRYAIDGQLQAVVDEYLHVLKDWRGFLQDGATGIIGDLAEVAYSALSLRTVSYATDDPVVRGSEVDVRRRSIRGRFAVRFGDRAIEGEQQQHRAQQVSQAFNSPFWPFVLSTTSVGQEGLDFHLYSHSVVHWNLPSNPVDFEQREGRVHRYKGHAIRKNVAAACASAAFDGGDDDPWARMFDAAVSLTADEGTDLSPYWVFHPEGSPARIERYVPVLPLSRDSAKLERLLKAVATYRLSFGQPRQEELVHYLAGRIPETRISEIVSRLSVDLSPPRTNGSS